MPHTHLSYSASIEAMLFLQLGGAHAAATHLHHSARIGAMPSLQLRGARTCLTKLGGG